jgi:hypothetical protein
MGIRSEVGIAVKKEFVEAFKDVLKSVDLGLKEDEIKEKEEGSLFIYESIKWYTDEQDIQKITTYLHGIGDENYRLIEVGSEYPDTGDDLGSWDNPFNLGVVHQLYFEE